MSTDQIYCDVLLVWVIFWMFSACLSAYKDMNNSPVSLDIVLFERISQYVPKKLAETMTAAACKVEKCNSAVTKHLKENPVCLQDDTTKQFVILK